MGRQIRLLEALLGHFDPAAVKEIGKSPVVPSGEWAIDAALIERETPWVKAEVFPPHDHTEDEEPGDISHLANAFSGTVLPRPQLDIVIG